MLTQAEMRADIRERVAGLSPEEVETFRRAAEFIIEMASDVFAAPPSDREWRYQAAKAKGASVGLLPAVLPSRFDARHLGGILKVATAAESVLRGSASIN